MCVSLAFRCNSNRSFFSIETVIGIFFTFQIIYAKISKSIKARNLFLNICFYHLKLKKNNYEALFNNRYRCFSCISRLRKIPKIENRRLI